MKRFQALAGATILALGAASLARADTYIGSVSYYDNATTPIYGGATTSGPASYTLGSGTNFATSESSAAGGGSVHAISSADAVNTGASSYLQYIIMLKGPVGPAVPVTVAANLFVNGSGFFANFPTDPRFLVKASFGVDTAFVQLDDSVGAGPHALSFSQVLDLTPSFTYLVRLDAEADSGGANGAGLATAEAYVDPTFTVDPAYASLYTITGVPSVAPSAVPEPASWALVLFGFASLGAALRRRRTGLATTA